MGTLLMVAVWAGVISFVLGSIFRLARYARAPVHLRWDLYPVAHEPRRDHGGSYLEEHEWWTKPRHRSLLGEVTAMAEEITLLAGVWRNNRAVWFGSFPFHWGLYLMLLTTVGLVGVATGLLPTVVVEVVRWVGLAGGVLLALGAAILLAQRIFSRRLAPYTTPLDRLNLLLLVVLGVLSAAVALSETGMVLAMAAVAMLLRFEPVPVPPLLAAQMAVAAAFLLYLPFTRMIHVFSKYFLYHEVRWDDEPRTAGTALDRKVQAALNYGVSWSAPHVGAGRSWAAVATSAPTPAKKES